MAKRAFGTVDKLPSGRFRARFRGPDGRRHAKVLGTRADAWAWLATQQTDLLRRIWRALSAYDLMCRWAYCLTCRSRGGLIMASAAPVG